MKIKLQVQKVNKQILEGGQEIRNLGTHWGFKWILTDNFKFWIQSNIIILNSGYNLILYSLEKQFKSYDTKINYL